MEDNIKIELLTPLTGNFTSRELERQWEEGEYEYDVYEGLPLEGADLSQYESEIKEAIEKYCYGIQPIQDSCGKIPYHDDKSKAQIYQKQGVQSTVQNPERRKICSILQRWIPKSEIRSRKLC